ncbi:hypothetical protein [Pseudomonas phage ANB1]|nr:hypothetical protein [Pseudomonas phage ANB1]
MNEHIQKKINQGTGRLAMCNFDKMNYVQGREYYAISDSGLLEQIVALCAVQWPQEMANYLHDESALFWALFDRGIVADGKPRADRKDFIYERLGFIHKKKFKKYGLSILRRARTRSMASFEKAQETC